MHSRAYDVFKFRLPSRLMFAQFGSDTIPRWKISTTAATTKYSRRYRIEKILNSLECLTIRTVVPRFRSDYFSYLMSSIRIESNAMQHTSRYHIPRIEIK